MRHDEGVAIKRAIGRTHIAWSFSILVAVFTTHCIGGESCSDETYCQFDDLGSWCAANPDRCTTVGASAPQVAQGANVYSQSPWTFSGPAAQSVTIPMSDHRSELPQKPLLHVVARANGNWSFEVVDYPKLLIDSSPADCELGDFGDMIEWRCAPTGSVATVEVDFAGTGSFALTVALEEVQCTGSRKVCGL